MKSSDANKKLSQIDSAINEITSFSSVSVSEQSYLAKFLVVFISGIYEESIETIINEMVGKLEKKEISNFIEESIRYGFRNPEIKNIKKLLGKFKNDQWEKEIDALPKETKDAIDSICANKNALAHGNLVTITLGEVLEYYHKSRPVIEKIDDILL